MQSIIVFSHLRWNFVFQRPQHLMSRLAERYRILFIEEPEQMPDKQDFKLSTPLPNLTVCTPMSSGNPLSFDVTATPALRAIVREVAADHADPLVWFYTPMALPLLDELEDELLTLADIVFTGGPSLYAAKRNRHHNVHCFPSSVDTRHFRQARDKTFAHPSQHALPRPRLGFYGVVDERFDTGLLAQAAALRPEWQFVIVGPVVKIDPATLPQADNIHYLGQQPYSALPQFLAAWDVCLMPFALNESTRFISPTKSLEYMAAELPIVSTPVRDVVDAHGDVVHIASGAGAFVKACEQVLAMSAEERLTMCRVMRDKLSRTSWDYTAARMGELLDRLGAGKLAGLPAAPLSTSTGIGHAAR